MCATLG